MENLLNRVVWFEIYVADLDRAQKFYEAAFDISLNRQEMQGIPMAWFPMGESKDGLEPGAPGTLIQMDGISPSKDGSVVYLHVADIDATLAKIEAAGGKTLAPKMDIGKHGSVAHFEDTEGNRVALHMGGE